MSNCIQYKRTKINLHSKKKKKKINNVIIGNIERNCTENGN